MGGQAVKNTLFWAAYGIAAVGATAHTYQVFLLSDPSWLAFIAAIGVDMLLAYCLYSLSDQMGNQRIAGVIGIVVLASISGTAQVVQRFNGLEVGLLPWMQWASLFLVPVSTTGGLVLLGVVRYFQTEKRGGDNRNKQQFRPQRDQRPVEQEQSNNGRERAPHPSSEAPH